ncbi:ABC transporter ATP-binding protein [Halomarina pelagica]|uniref:ABC transporter ATP-binding protein n=1 Tax=Halomarina pelagica TaxID=2961599 RepID=UPI0020C1E9FD|nr:ABC transporter ATP-binding protein [Halomarina sp. BND7]
MSPFAIEATGLSKRYGDEIAVEGLDLAVPHGTVYGFLGPNGAGKTTTIRMLTTLLRPTAGEARIDGQPIADRRAVTRRIGYLPDAPPLYDELTGREQLEYVAGLRDIPNEEASARIGELLERFSLDEDADKRISTYSKGMKQKAGIIQAILHRPAVIFLDEPTAGLDPRAARTVRDTIADLAAGDATVFLSTHVLPVVDELADTVGVLFDGDLVAEGPPEVLKRRAAESVDGDARDGEGDGEGEGRTLEDVFLEVTQDADLVRPDGAERAR